MLLSLLQLHAATFSALIATPDSTECMLEVCFFLGTLGFLGTPFCVRFAGTSSGSVNVFSVPSVISLSVPVSSLSLPRFEGTQIIIIRLFHACKICKADKNVIRGSHKQLCIKTPRWDFETTDLDKNGWNNSRESNDHFQPTGLMSPGVTFGAKLTSFPSIDPGTRTFMNELTI